MDYLKLGLGDLASIAVGIEFSKWGQNIAVSCVYNPQGENRAFKIIFYGCSQFRWESIEVDQLIDDSVELLGIDLGAEQHQRPALINTDAFELAVWYKHYQVQK